MRPFHCTITPAVIQRKARQALQGPLDWKPFHDSVSVDDLLDLLVLMAATTASLFATVRRFFRFSHETARRAVQANLPTMERLVAALVQALFDVADFSRSDRRRSWLVAIDTHNVAYYGQRGAYVVGGPKKQGTSWFFSYATAVLLHHHRRYTVALCPLPAKTKPHEIVRTLLDQIAAQGLKIRGVTLDSAFDSGDTLLLLQERGLAYAVPLRRKGATRNARNRCFEGRHGLIRWAEWTTEKTRRLVRTRTLLWKGRPKTMVFAFQGWSGGRARNIHQQARRQQRLYRQRFGIETSYRQKNQAQAQTTSRNPVYRLLLEGIAYVMRQVWVVLTEQLARCSHAGPGAWMAALTMQKMIDWLVHELTALHPEERSISIGETGSIQ
jgi:Transposase DDE domain